MEKYQLKHRKVWLGIGLVMVAAIIVLSLITPPDINLPVQSSDKVLHVSAYFVLTFWFMQIIKGFKPSLWLGMSFVALGIGLEFAQATTGYRQYEVADMLANASGVVAGWLLGRTLLGSLLWHTENLLLGRSHSAR